MKIFKLIKSSNNHEIHILGTFHNVSPNILTQAALNFINNHDSLVVETSEALVPLSLTDLQKMNFLKIDDENVILPPHQYRMLKKGIEEYLEHKNATADITIDILNARGLYHIYTQSLHLNGMDNSIMRQFKNSGKDIKGLESREDLSPFFEKVTIKEVEYLLKLVEDDIENQALCDVESKFLYFTNFSFETNSEMEVKELSERNGKWMPKILDSSESSIICVGAFHLYEEYGLLYQLKNQGYSIYQMNYSGEFEEIDNSRMFLTIPKAQDFSDFVGKEIHNTYGQDYYNNYIKLLNDTPQDDMFYVTNKFLSQYSANFINLDNNLIENNEQLTVLSGDTTTSPSDS